MNRWNVRLIVDFNITEPAYLSPSSELSGNPGSSPYDDMISCLARIGENCSRCRLHANRLAAERT